MCNTVMFLAVVYERSLFTLVMYKISFLPAYQQLPLNSQELRKYLINNSLSIVLNIMPCIQC